MTAFKDESTIQIAFIPSRFRQNHSGELRVLFEIILISLKMRFLLIDFPIIIIWMCEYGPLS